MQVASRLFSTTRRPCFHSFYYSQSTRFYVTHRARRAQQQLSAKKQDSTARIPPETVVKHVITKIQRALKWERRMDDIEVFIHRVLDKALVSTSSHQKVYEGLIAYLIKDMWAQPAASIYLRMCNIGFITSDSIEARMLATLLPDSENEDCRDLILSRIGHIISKRDFKDDDFLLLLRVLQDYDVKPIFILKLIQAFLHGKGTEYSPPPEVISSWLQAAISSGDRETLSDIFEKGDWTIKLAAIAEACNMVNNDGPNHKLVTRLVHAVADPATTEADLLRSLDTITKADPQDNQVKARIWESFLANRDADYIPSPDILRAAIIAFIHADRVDQAFALLDRVGMQPAHLRVHRAFLATLQDTRPSDHDSFTKLLSAMDKAGISIDTSILNVVISREVRLKRVGQALFLYNEMKKHPGMLPDSFTFGSLFAMYRRIRPASLKQASAAAKFDNPAFPLRLLFRELVQSTKRHKRRVKPNATLLNTALRACMRQRDYVAAIVVIQSFERYRVPLNHKTYYCVIKLLVRRIWREAQSCRPQDEVRWVDRFLGVRHYTDIVLDRTLVHDIFALLRQKNFDVSAPLYVPKRIRRRRYMTQPWLLPQSGDASYAFPTMEMMESVERPDEPEGFVYEPIPLIRVLSRAAVAAATAEDVSLEEAAKNLKEWINIAKAEMQHNFPSKVL